jgi:isopenicillin-N N-acyltransferase-like protein
VTVARHHSSERRSADRGLQFGRAQAGAVANTAAVYARIFREDRGLGPMDIAGHAREVEAEIRAFRPALAEEIEGIAAGAGQPADLLFAINARTELLAGGALAGATVGECSTVATVDAAHASGLLVQNWDFHPDLRGSRVVWMIDEAGGRRFTTFTEAGIVAKIGASSDGVALAINFLASELDGGLEGVPVHVLCRAVLAEARTVQEARDLVAGTTVSASVCMTVAGPDAAGGVTARAFELWPGGMAELAPDPERPWIAHTNHFLGPIGVRDVIAEGGDGASSRGRMQRLVATLERTPAPDAARLTELLSWRGGPGLEPIFRTEDPDLPWLRRCATLATLAFEVPGGRVSLV